VKEFFKNNLLKIKVITDSTTAAPVIRLLTIFSYKKIKCQQIKTLLKQSKFNTNFFK